MPREDGPPNKPEYHHFVTKVLELLSRLDMDHAMSGVELRQAMFRGELPLQKPAWVDYAIHQLVDEGKVQRYRRLRNGRPFAYYGGG